MATYMVETFARPGVIYEVGQAEYERLLEAGLLVGGPTEPDGPEVFDNEVAALLLDRDSAAHAAGDAEFTLRATTLPPTKYTDATRPIGEVWIS
jgi:hypothetical protein